MTNKRFTAMNTAELSDAICEIMEFADVPLNELQQSILAAFLGGYFINEKPLTISEIERLSNLDRTIKEQQQ